MTLKAPATTKPAGTDLLEAYIDEFDADWQHTLLSHSRLVTERLGLYEAQSAPSSPAGHESRRNVPKCEGHSVGTSALCHITGSGRVVAAPAACGEAGELVGTTAGCLRRSTQPWDSPSMAPPSP